TPPSVNPQLSRWSPDGSSVAFISLDRQRQLNSLYVINADGTNLTHVSDNACEFVEWAPDSSRLLFDAGQCGNATTLQGRTVRADGSDPQVIWSQPRDPNGVAGNMVSVSWQALKP